MTPEALWLVALPSDATPAAVDALNAARLFMSPPAARVPCWAARIAVNEALSRAARHHVLRRAASDPRLRAALIAAFEMAPVFWELVEEAATPCRDS